MLLVSKIKVVLEPKVVLKGKLEPKNEIKVNIQGTGPRGAAGIDAYELWLSKGHEGTLEDFFRSIGGDAYVYTHPETHSADMIEETEERNFISVSEKEKALETYVYYQIEGSDEWVITHNLDKYPSVSVVDTGDSLVGGSVEYLSKNELVVTFTASFSGKAFLN